MSLPADKANRAAATGAGFPDRRPEPRPTLDKLVSPAAAMLYDQVSVEGTVPADVDGAALAELMDLSLLRPSGAGAELHAVAKSQAIQRLIARREVALHARLHQLQRGWARLEELVEGAAANDGSLEQSVEIVNGRNNIQDLITDLYRSARRELRAATTGKFDGVLTEDYLLTASAPAKESAARFRGMYDHDYASSPAGARIIEMSIASGEEARIRAELPTRMLLVDDSVALIALTHTGLEGSALVRSPPLLTLLREWFDALWTAPGTVDAAARSGDELSPREFEVLRLLSTGLTDEAIARALGISVKTVRRSVGTILDALDVSSRFAAGAAAARRQWV